MQSASVSTAVKSVINIFLKPLMVTGSKNSNINFAFLLSYVCLQKQRNCGITQLVAHCSGTELVRLDLHVARQQKIKDRKK